MPQQLHFPWIPEDACLSGIRQSFESRKRKHARKQRPVIFTIGLVAARDRLIEHFLRRSAEPPDLLEEELIINDMATYMGYLFELGYRDFESNKRKLIEDLGAAVSLRGERSRLQRERKLAAMMRTVSLGAQHIN